MCDNNFENSSILSVIDLGNGRDSLLTNRHTPERSNTSMEQQKQEPAHSKFNKPKDYSKDPTLIEHENQKNEQQEIDHPDGAEDKDQGYNGETDKQELQGVIQKDMFDLLNQVVDIDGDGDDNHEGKEKGMGKG